MLLLEDLGLLQLSKTDKKKYRFGIFECPICKIGFRTMFKSVLSGKSTKCRTCASSKYFAKNTRILTAWYNINKRCSDTKDSLYGGRGIKNLFTTYKEFENWALENGYDDGLEIDRINPNGNYDPVNCRWVGEKIQSQNTRLLRNTNTSGYRGVNWSKAVKKWVARGTLNSKRIFLGYYDRQEDAALAYDDFIINNKLEHPTNIRSKNV